jgi:NAD(P)-dependent dehydrogenase (short-subunit alcohol dehydrogenase family)
VNAVDPGATETPLMRSVPHELHSRGAQSPEAVGKPEDVAEVVLFLASNTAEVTGQIYSVRLRS